LYILAPDTLATSPTIKAIRLKINFMNTSQILPRLAMSAVLLFTLGETFEGLLEYFQAPNVFGGIAAIASCVGASMPVLTIFKDSDSE